MASMSILNLSNEILWNIFGYFCLHCQHEYNQSWDDRPFRSQDSSRGKQQPDAKSWYSIDRHALFSLSLTSKRFRDLAQPILYHEFVLGYGDSWLSESYTWEGRLVSFIRTLSRRSDLAHRVKVMYIHTSLFGRNTDESRTANRLVILEAAHALGIDLPEAWRQRMSRVTDAESCDWPEVYQVFLGCYLDDKSVTLRKLLDACTGGLVAFEYEAAKDETQGLRGGHFQASDAIEYLDKHKSTLQVLHLDLSKRDVQMRKIPPDSSLKEFSALKHVFINSMPLFGFIQKREQNVDSRVLIRLLPPSIASLTIEKNHYRNFVKEALFDLADWKIQNPGEFPNLTWVACRPKSKSSTLASLFQAVGVNFNAQVRSLSKIKPYLNGPNASSILVFPNWDSDDDL
ncbi:hypothetical protein NW759_015420 [Fusarium solani]|nr:hypothetical protein NW759_015420 [Fusarium solani]